MSPEMFQRPEEIPTSVLADLAKRLLIDPLSESQGPNLNGLADPELSALALLLKALRIRTEDLVGSRQSQLRLLSEISSLISRQNLSPGQREQAGARLSDRGLLPISAYRVEFARDWTEFARVFPEREALIQDLMRHQVAFRHLMPENRSVDFPAVTLLARRIEQKRGLPFVMLVIAERLASVLRVYSAWRVPMELVPPSAEPLAVLHAFVDRFGVLLNVPNRPPRQFIYYDTVDSGFMDDGGLPLTLHDTNSGPAVGTVVYRKGDLGQLEIAIGFAIDVHRYRELSRLLR